MCVPRSFRKYRHSVQLLLSWADTTDSIALAPVSEQCVSCWHRCCGRSACSVRARALEHAVDDPFVAHANILEYIRALLAHRADILCMWDDISDNPHVYPPGVRQQYTLWTWVWSCRGKTHPRELMWVVHFVESTHSTTRNMWPAYTFCKVPNPCATARS